MSAISLGNAFAAGLHREVLKPRGFVKAARTFTRTHDHFVEAIQIQGSSWNSGIEPWSFYINVLVSFPDIPYTKFCVGPRYHGWSRLNMIVLEAPPVFELTASNMNDLIFEIGQLIADASKRLPSLLAPVRERASSGLLSFLPMLDA